MLENWINSNRLPQLEKPIACPKCGKNTGLTQEGMKYFCILKDIKCKFCNYVIFHAKQTIC